MTSRFYKQLGTCTRSAVLPPQVERGDSSPLISRTIRDNVPVERRLEHEREAAFLKALIAHEESEASHQLQDNLVKADR